MTVQHIEESLDPTKELARLIAERKFEEAFNKALALTNVGIVSWLCNQVNWLNVCADQRLIHPRNVLSAGILEC